MSKTIRIKRGVDINLEGKAEKIYAQARTPKTYALKPTDFFGVKAKLSVREGDEVKAGSPLFYSKDRENIKFCSPVSGEVVEVVRGDKRKLLEIRVLADAETRYENFGAGDPAQLSADEIKSKLMASGCWPMILQRPYNVIANPERSPRDIFISCFDSSPISADVEFVLHDRMADFQKGLEVLKALTEGKVHLGLNGKTKNSIFENAQGVEKHYFSGPHPAGNVGVQIHHTAPINKGEVVWTVDPQHVAIIGQLFSTGEYRADIQVAIAGSGFEQNRYAKTKIGAAVEGFVEGNLKASKQRLISGTVLTGQQISSTGYLGYYASELTAIPEGEEDQFFGWITPNFGQFSISRTLFSWMMPNKSYNLDTGMHGEERAYVVTGEYEKVFPFDIFPVQLIKSIMVRDIEAMENLGIYEVVPEDFALCEVVCTSKIPVQETVQEGLSLMLKELGD